jgi:hypothetical protein
MEKKQDYVIYKDGHYYDNFLWDTTKGYWLLMEDVRRLKEKYPSSTIEAVKVSEHKQRQKAIIELKDNLNSVKK